MQHYYLDMLGYEDVAFFKGHKQVGYFIAQKMAVHFLTTYVVQVYDVKLPKHYTSWVDFESSISLLNPRKPLVCQQMYS